MNVEVERGIPDFIGDEVFVTVAADLLIASCVNLTCLAAFDRSSPGGVVGTDGRALSRFGLLGLLAKLGMAEGFFMLELGCLNMDLTRSNLHGLRRAVSGSGFGILLIVADLVRPRGVSVLARLGLDEDRDRVGIWVLGCLTVAARAREACVGEVIDASKLACERG